MMIIGTFGASSGFILLADMGRGKIEALAQRGMAKNSIDTLSQMVESGYFKELNKISGVQILDEGR